MVDGKTHQILKLVVTMAVSYAVAALGATASVSAQSYYAALNQPAWAPPGWIFGPVWSTLYTMMGVSAWLVWRKRNTGEIANELSIFCIQLAFNGLWSWLFFKWQLGAAAFADILILLILIILNVIMFWRRSKLAGILLLPYLVWMCFATVLCYTVWQMNPQALG